MEVAHERPAEAYTATCKMLMAEGQVAHPRGQATREVLNVQLRIAKPWCVPFTIDGRKLNPSITGIEYSSLVGQIGVEPMSRKMARVLIAYHDYNVAFGNYGSRLRGQFMHVVKELTDDPDSRRAVMTIYHGPQDLRRETKDVPCTLTLQFLIRRNKLHLRVSMRSNDAYLGLPYDLQQFCLLHLTMAQVLRCDVGEYTHSVGSMHLYERDAKKVSDFGTSSYMELGDEPLYVMESAEPLQRLASVVAFCQDISCGFPVKPITRFERWLEWTLR